jgi:hypothetical protein
MPPGSTNDPTKINEVSAPDIFKVFVVRGWSDKQRRQPTRQGRSLGSLPPTYYTVPCLLRFYVLAKASAVSSSSSSNTNPLGTPDLISLEDGIAVSEQERGESWVECYARLRNNRAT